MRDEWTLKVNARGLLTKVTRLESHHRERAAYYKTLMEEASEEASAVFHSRTWQAPETRPEQFTGTSFVADRFNSAHEEALKKYRTCEAKYNQHQRQEQLWRQWGAFLDACLLQVGDFIELSFDDFLFFELDKRTPGEHEHDSEPDSDK